MFLDFLLPRVASHVSEVLIGNPAAENFVSDPRQLIGNCHLGLVLVAEPEDKFVVFSPVEALFGVDRALCGLDQQFPQVWIAMPSASSFF